MPTFWTATSDYPVISILCANLKKVCFSSVFLTWHDLIVRKLDSRRKTLQDFEQVSIDIFLVFPSLIRFLASFSFTWEKYCNSVNLAVEFNSVNVWTETAMNLELILLRSFLSWTPSFLHCFSSFPRKISSFLFKR